MVKKVEAKDGQDDIPYGSGLNHRLVADNFFDAYTERRRR
jgi:hypothetical protein